ncbi:hypothetical protein LTR86_008931 [Recurvomyces mirabilis]|nr:hypothetical protein LTR86_008931 [Recurvomyces mirabilis]
MPITTSLSTGLDEVDVLICGGGLAACVVAGRLAEADPDLVLMVEGGPNNADFDIFRHPALFIMNILPNSKTALSYKSKKSKQLADREVVVQSGGTLGGGSSINIMLKVLSPCTRRLRCLEYSRLVRRRPSAVHEEDPIDSETGFFTDEHDIDVKMAVWAYKKTREIMRRTFTYRGEAPEEHPMFPTGSTAGLYYGQNSPISQGEVQSLLYSAEDDTAIEQRLRERIATTWHSLGTCPMKSRQNGGVVDKDLNVYGVQGLKVVDLSIPPKNVGANTQITAYTIGEKGADIVIKELGIGCRAAHGGAK